MGEAQTFSGRAFLLIFHRFYIESTNFGRSIVLKNVKVENQLNFNSSIAIICIISIIHYSKDSKNQIPLNSIQLKIKHSL